jgi:Zn finger protein HypA/HybF involved in hydrogenase expression
MHELSIAESILELARRHVPPGERLVAVTVRAGPLRAIDESAMSLAWRATTDNTAYDGCLLKLQQLPWRLRCPRCQRVWQHTDRFAVCSCGCETPAAIGGDELDLTSINVEPMTQQPAAPAAAAAAIPHAGSG